MVMGAVLPLCLTHPRAKPKAQSALNVTLDGPAPRTYR